MTTTTKRAARGSGSVVERPVGSGVWRLRYRQESTGREIQKTFHGSRAGAARELRRLLNETAPPTPDRVVMTFGDLLDEWLAYGRTVTGRPWARKTAAENRRQVDVRIKPVLGAVPLDDLKPADLERTYLAWQDASCGRALADSSVHKLAALIGSALSFAFRREYIDRNPADRAVAPAQPKSTAKAPTAGELLNLIKAGRFFGHDMDKAIVLGAVTGARRSEVAALLWGDLDLESGRVRIERQVVEVAGAMTIEPTKTGAQYIARLSKSDLAVLVHVLGVPGPSNTYVINGGTEPVRPDVLTDRFTSVRRDANVPGVTFHSLRHFWSSAKLAGGVPVHDVAEGRWTSTRMVLDTYGHGTEEGSDQLAAVSVLPGLTVGSSA